MRLIDADALGYEVAEEYGADGGSDDVNVIYGMIINAPTVDAEVFVYCKDCTKWKNEHLCSQWSKYGTIETKETDFCSYGRSKW